MVIARSRQMISSELLIGLLTIGCGVAGGYGDGSLHGMLRDLNWVRDWTVLMIGLGSLLTILAVCAHFEHHERPTMWLAYLRCNANVFCAPMWVIVFWLMTSRGLAPRVWSIWMMSLVAPIWCLVSWFANLRLALALDRTKETPGLIADRRRH